MPATIESIRAHKILNSRGDWTIETLVELSDGSIGVQTVPDGASKGENEAVYVDAKHAVEHVSHTINDLLHGKDPFDFRSIDDEMIQMDGTPNKSNLGGNSILSVSLAVAKACAKSRGIELYAYLAELYGQPLRNIKFPTPLFNILNGGKHANNGLSFQEFMVIPSPALKINEAIEMGTSIYHTLEGMLDSDGISTEVGDEGGFAPKDFTVDKALSYIKKAASQNYKVGEQVFFGMDVAAESFYNSKSQKYTIAEEDLDLDYVGLADYYNNLLQNYEIISIEDPCYENDHEGWKHVYDALGSKLMIVADDLAVTNPKFLKIAIDKGLANAVIVKPNQVGSLSETFDFIKMAQGANMSVIVSHRSGETAEDTFIADLSIAVGADFIKTGAPARGERVVKYNRLLQIYDNLGF